MVYISKHLGSPAVKHDSAAAVFILTNNFTYFHQSVRLVRTFEQNPHQCQVSWVAAMQEMFSVLFDKNMFTLRYCESLVNVSNFMIMSYLNIRYEEAKVISRVDKPDLSWHGAQLKYIGFQWLFILLFCLSGSVLIVPTRNMRNSSKVGIMPALFSFLIRFFINFWTAPNVIHSFDSVVYSLLSLS